MLNRSVLEVFIYTTNFIILRFYTLFLDDFILSILALFYNSFKSKSLLNQDIAHGSEGTAITARCSVNTKPHYRVTCNAVVFVVPKDSHSCSAIGAFLSIESFLVAVGLKISL